MKTLYKFFSIFALIALLALAFAAPAKAFDGRAGENVEIKADEVIEDDVYVTANEFVLEGTVKGDLVVFGSTIIINGTVEGDLIAAGQTITINGTVTDDARIAGAVLQLGKTAVIGGDVVAGSASLEAEAGSTIEGELVVGAAQTLLDGKISGDVLAGAGALELNGEFGGDVKAEVGNPEEGGPPPTMYMPQADLDFPTVKPGFNVGEDAKIKGNLEYTQSKDVKIPANAVGGKITRTEPVVNAHEVEVKPTPAEAAMTWTFDLFRTIITWILFGLLLGWLAPVFMKALMEKLQSQPAASLGWGLVAYAAFFFAILVIFIAMLMGGIFFGILTLGGLSGTIVWIGILALFAMIVGFILITAFLTKIVVAWLSGKLILSRVKPELAEHKFLPLVVGVVIVALLVALPYIGWLFGMIIMFIGLGALWIWGRDLWQAQKTAA
jgi:cytoskeletal protein CcmA (bactofilin family)